ncbi:MAG: OmpA family protein [Saprospiraceae bacterium]|nr:OmpA family protein [Saprospiraceae bacterium]
MRKLTLSLFLVCVMLTAVFAQNKMNPYAIQAKLNLIDYNSLKGEDIAIGEGFELALFRNAAPFLNIGVPFKLGLVKLPGKKDNTPVASFDLIFRLENMSSTAKIVPYAFGGGGYAFEKGNNHAQIPFGVGAHFRVSPYAFINLQGEFRKALTDDRDNIQIGLGYVYLLHASEQPASIGTLRSDRDKDGTEDAFDQCPDVPGSMATMGCPDRDSDGIADAKDDCPDEAGMVATKGCPDYDKDGVADREDLCPQEAGAIERKGCPAVKDGDGDGFPDNSDECPSLPGPNNGCPDSDGDGVADNHDNCPGVTGTVANMGCPEEKEKDSDGDGIPDRLDKCPTEIGSPATDGCPLTKDSDGDGVLDNVDLCPTIAGAVDNFGCPAQPKPTDTDGDGVNDKDDRCPNTPGLIGNDGCPEVKQEVKEKLAIATKAVQFETGKAVLKRESYAVLDDVINILRLYPEYALAISGHTDDIGNDERNLRLSEERAKTCYDYLVFRGIKRDRLRHAGFGEARPIASNETPEGREQNRRVEFEVIFD